MEEKIEKITKTEKEITTDNNDNRIEDVDSLTKEIFKLRQKPLLILYYPDHYTDITDDDIEDIDSEFRRIGCTEDNKIEDLDVFLHTYGGDPDSAYLIAQVIRYFSNNVNFLIPIHSTSAGTLICMCANKILLGDYAVLSSIDIHYDDETELVNIDYFMKFASDCRKKIEDLFVEKSYGNAESHVESDLLKEMVKQVKAINIGKFYREKNLTGFYARRLMLDYMFENKLNKKELTDNIIKNILYENPSHDFRMDYNICKMLELPVERMEDKEYKICKKLILKLQELTIANVICMNIDNDDDNSNYKLPYIRLYSNIDNEENIENKKKFNSIEIRNLMYNKRRNIQKFKHLSD